MSVRVRRARTVDIARVRELVDLYAEERILLSKPTVALYEDVQEFWVAELSEQPGHVVGCGALHVMWDDLAEIRTVATDPAFHGRGVGSAIIERLVETAREVGVSKLFCLTFEVDFFARHGFVEIDGTPVDPDVYEELLKSYDVGVAEFLDLESVKPNTLGNTRMIRHL